MSFTEILYSQTAFRLTKSGPNLSLLRTGNPSGDNVETGIQQVNCWVSGGNKHVANYYLTFDLSLIKPWYLIQSAVITVVKSGTIGTPGDADYDSIIMVGMTKNSPLTWNLTTDYKLCFSTGGQANGPKVAPEQSIVDANLNFTFDDTGIAHLESKVGNYLEVGLVSAGNYDNSGIDPITGSNAYNVNGSASYLTLTYEKPAGVQIIDG